MSLFEKLKQTRMQAMRNQDTVTKNILTVLIGDVQNIELRTGLLKEEQVVALIKKYVTNAQETMALADIATAQVLSAEIAVLEQFLPKQMSPEDIEAAVIASGASNLGAAMAYLKNNFAGEYDGRVASEIVKRVLSPA
jgi:uncharacterized protein